ncbi:MAG: hypothetical protein HY010_02180 [Acidobacteria bacterium]|nr:hypothetical protein [Acidobacteriota bacterium]
MKAIRAFWGPGLILAIVLFGFWYNTASNYDYGVLAGTYGFDGNGENCVLQLRADRTFVQELRRSGEIKRAEGHWDRYGEAHVSFSHEFLKLSGQEMNTEGQAHGQFDKAFGIFPTLVLAPLPNGPHFRKKLIG